MSLSPQQLEAGNVLFQNQGIRVSPGLTSAITKYTTLPGIGNLLATITTGAVNGNITSSTIGKLKILAANTCPALGDAVPTGYVELTVPTAPPGFTGLISNTANTLVGDNDVGKFAQMLAVACSYVDSTNEFINAGVNSEDYLKSTFSSMDDLSSSDLTFVTTNPQAFAQDLRNLGNAINLAAIDELGSPLALLRQVVKQGGFVTPLVEQLYNAGLPYETIITLTDPKTLITPIVEKAIYTAMTNIKNADLVQIAQILCVSLPVSQGVPSTTNTASVGVDSISANYATTPGSQLLSNLQEVNEDFVNRVNEDQYITPGNNTTSTQVQGALDSMADLLNVKKLFPNSYMSLTTPTCDGVKNIYQPANTPSEPAPCVVPYPGRIIKYGDTLTAYLYHGRPNTTFTTNFGFSGTTDSTGYAVLGSYPQYTAGYTTYNVYIAGKTAQLKVYVTELGVVA